MSDSVPNNQRSPVRKLDPRAESHESQSSQGPVRGLKPRSGESKATAKSPRKVLLYRDEAVIRSMRDQITAAALRDENSLEKLRRSVAGRSLLSGGFTFDGLTGVDEFVLRPAAKWNLGAEIGAEFELKWNLGGDRGLDNVVLMLFSVMPVYDVGVVVQRIKFQQSDTPIAELIYPSMPINIRGVVTERTNIHSSDILLQDKRHTVKLQFNIAHRLEQSAHFLEKRLLCVLGIVQSIGDEVAIDVGAIALGSIEEMYPK